VSPTYLLECFWPGVSESQLSEIVTRAAGRTDNGSNGDRIRYLDSILVPTDEIVLCVVSGPSAEAVRAHAERAGLRCDRVIESVQIQGGEAACAD
jgi:hypothetical protein